MLILFFAFLFNTKISNRILVVQRWVEISNRAFSKVRTTQPMRFKNFFCTLALALLQALEVFRRKESLLTIGNGGC